MGGRHPGYYFVAEQETTDFVRIPSAAKRAFASTHTHVHATFVLQIKAAAVCPKAIPSNVTEVGRGAAVAEYFEDEVVLCGGRDKANKVMDSCVAYSPMTDQWAEHSVLLEPREEAASVLVSGQVRLTTAKQLIQILRARRARG